MARSPTDSKRMRLFEVAVKIIKKNAIEETRRIFSASAERFASCPPSTTPTLFRSTKVSTLHNARIFLQQYSKTLLLSFPLVRFPSDCEGCKADRLRVLANVPYPICRHGISVEGQDYLG